jgi:hypothetical protein
MDIRSRGDQDLKACAEELSADPRFADAQVLSRSSRVDFFVEDFEILWRWFG